MTKEEIYDDQINPLMARIINVCKEHNIPFIASFQLTGEDTEEVIFCNSSLLPDGSSAVLSKLAKILQRNTSLVTKEPQHD